MASLLELHSLGQSVWLDFIDRRLLAGGALKQLIAHGVHGVTSNPTIFNQAIRASNAYDPAVRDWAAAHPDGDLALLYEHLTVQDVQLAADQLRQVYDTAAGLDGFVSLEVSPRLAHDSDGTVAAAHHLWKAVMRPNLMIKVPATRAGIAAIERLVADGINVNATLLFSPQRYEEVARAYLRGLERCVYPEGVASVASVFVSRIDAKLDPLLARIDRPEARALEGQVAVANGKLIYQRFHELFAAALAANRTVQRPLWASTGTKNPHYSDVLYVETLIGAHTVATLPQDTLAAFVNHGQVRATLAADAAGARRTLAALAELGVDFATIAEELEREGVAKFVAAYDDTLAALAEKRRALTGRAMVGA